MDDGMVINVLFFIICSAFIQLDNLLSKVSTSFKLSNSRVFSVFLLLPPVKLFPSTVSVAEVHIFRFSACDAIRQKKKNPFLYRLFHKSNYLFNYCNIVLRLISCSSKKYKFTP